MDNQHKFGSKAYEPNASSTIKFEVKSLIGRLFSPGVRTHNFPLLHIGCSSNLLDGFENLDFYTIRFWKTKRLGHDFRYPLPFKDSTFEGAFSEHTLEHLCASDAISLLREIHRVLKPGAIFRVTVPDLKQYVNFYNGTNTNAEFNKFSNGCEAIWCLTHNWGHLSCWDSEMLIWQLVAAGFKSAKEVSFQNGADERLLCDQESRKWESLYVEAIV